MSRQIIKTRGFGAGGKNTNKNGLSFEARTCLSSRIRQRFTRKGTELIRFRNCNKELVCVDKSKLFTYMKKINELNLDIKPAKGCKRPDEAYIDLTNKHLFIIEKKFQQRPGSVEEKIQTGHFKQIHYNKLFPNYDVKYIYCLNEWFKNGFESELEYLEQFGINVFWGDSDSYKVDLIKFIKNYK